MPILLQLNNIFQVVFVERVAHYFGSVDKNCINYNPGQAVSNRKEDSCCKGERRMIRTAGLKGLVCFGFVLIAIVHATRNLVPYEPLIEEPVEELPCPFVPFQPLELDPFSGPLHPEIPCDGLFIVGVPKSDVIVDLQPAILPAPAPFVLPVPAWPSPYVPLPTICEESLCMHDSAMRSEEPFVADNTRELEELFCRLGSGELLGTSPMPCSNPPPTPFNTDESESLEIFEPIPYEPNIPTPRFV